ELLLEEGADPVELPTIEIKPPASWEALDKALRRLGEYHAAIFTSVNAVEAVFSRMQALGYDARRLAGVQVAAVGTMTAQALEQRGVRPDYVPDEFTGDALLKLLERQGVAGWRFLLPRTDIAPEGIALGLKKLGATVEQVETYRTVRPEPGLAAADWLHDTDVITFASSSAVRNLLDILGPKAKVPNRVAIACIGPTTAATAKELGLRVDLVAREHTIPGLVKALVSYFSPGAK
ncbi:MAG: uroporphyrinogen-III synthase, partial [Chloroflexi bacterium]|nr:uroporphyrinogen-III synthase [Chloroflexota bacterium]